MTTASRTNLGPLTTAFTYPSSCAYVALKCATCSYGWQAQTCSDNAQNTIGIQDNANCWPPRSNLDLATPVALTGWGFYSPGLACPTGYHTACSATGNATGGFGFMYSPAPSETAIGCCPGGYTCRFDLAYEVAQTCISIATTGSYATVQCSSGAVLTHGYATVPVTATRSISSSATTFAVTAVTLEAPLFQLMRQATDLATTSSSTSSSSTSSTSTTSAASTTSTATTTPSASSTSSTARLSGGAIAGIAVGSAVGGIVLLGGLAYFFYRRYQKQRKLGLASGQYAPAPTGSHIGKPELMADFPGSQYSVPTLAYEATPPPPGPTELSLPLRSELA